MEMFRCLFITLVFFISLNQGCRLWMCEAPDQHALLVHSDGTGFLYPDIVTDRGTHCSNNPKSQNHFKAIDIPESESVTAACPGEPYKNSWVDLPRNQFKNFEKSSLTLTCHNDQLVNNDMSIDWSDLECNQKVYPSLLISGISCGDQEGNIIIIGWRVDENMFIPQIETCFDKEMESTLYEHHFIHGRYIDAKAVDPWPRRPNFRHGKVYSTNVNNLYKGANQTKVFEKVLGGPRYLQELGLDGDFLARGHLAPDADFVTEAEQNATFYFVNVVPQWQGFNNGNWKKVEDATRDIAEEKGQTLSIWTGAYGVLNLPNDQGNNIPIYLGLLGNENIVAVPELMWKVVHNPLENQAVVFIGLNDIRESNNNEDFNRLCQDICSEIKWMNYNNDQTDAAKGKMICCSLHDAKRVIPTLSDLDHISLLRG